MNIRKFFGWLILFFVSALIFGTKATQCGIITTAITFIVAAILTALIALAISLLAE